MTNATIDRLKQALKLIAADRHKLVLLLGDFGSGKTRVLKQLAAEMSGEYIALNLALTERLLARPRRDYADGVTAHGLIDALCDECSPDKRLLCVDNVEVLFSPELGKLNPVDTFKRIARERPVVLALPVRRQGGMAVYSAGGRADYMQIPLEDYGVVEIGEA